jgi:hypothetical protein
MLRQLLTFRNVSYLLVALLAVTTAVNVYVTERTGVYAASQTLYKINFLGDSTRKRSALSSLLLNIRAKQPQPMLRLAFENFPTDISKNLSENPRIPHARGLILGFSDRF